MWLFVSPIKKLEHPYEAIHNIIQNKMPENEIRIDFQCSQEWLDMKECIEQMRKSIDMNYEEYTHLKDDVMTMQQTLKRVKYEQTILHSNKENESNELHRQMMIVSDTIEEEDEHSYESNDTNISNDQSNEMMTDRTKKYNRFTNKVMNAFGRIRKKVKQNGWSIYNTESIHSYAVATIQDSINTPSSSNRVKAWILSLTSLLVISAQLFTMNSLISESSQPTCATHTDCKEGQVCNGFKEFDMRQPRCQSCSYLNTQELGDSCDQIDELRNLDITSNLIWFEKDFTTHIDESISKNFWNDLNLASKCLARQYCIDTHPATADSSSVWSQNACSFFDIYISKISFDQMFVFGGVIILFASILTKDIEESLIESVLLEYIYPQHISSSNSIFYTTMIVRTALHMKRYILPWMTAGAGASILLSGTFSTRNVVLELLAVLFILEADNLFSSLLLPPDFLLSIDNLVVDARSHCDISNYYWVTHLQGIVVSVVMLLSIWQMYPTLVNLTSQPACASSDIVLYIIFAFISPISFMILETFINAIKIKSGLLSLLELSSKLIAYIIHVLLWLLSILTILKWNVFGNFGEIDVSTILVLCNLF